MMQLLPPFPRHTPPASRRRRRPAVVEPLEPRQMLAAARLPTVSIADASVNEGDAGTTNLVFTLTLSAPAKGRTQVRFNTLDGTATVKKADYRATSGWATFAAGSSQATVSVPIRGDTAIEADETLRLRLSSPVGCRLGRSTAVGTITNDDAPPPPPPTGSWTILVYMTGENLNDDAFDDINEMESALVGLPGSVRFAVGWDQPKASEGRAYATGGGRQAAWRTYGRSVLQADADTSTIASTFDLSTGERNTGAASTLVDFVTWGVAKAPASRYVLQLWGHGGGLDGSQFDSESRGDPLTINEIATALASPGMPTIDVVSYDNCLMAMAEVGTAVAASVPGVFVASEELVNSSGQDYTTAFAALATQNPGQVTAAQVAAGMVASYAAQYGGDPWLCDTFSATATSGYASLNAALREFVGATATLTADDRLLVRSAATGSAAYEYSSFRDLRGFMTRVAGTAGLPAAVRDAAAGVTAAVSAMLIAKTDDQRQSGGLSVYLPTDRDDAFLATYTTTASAFCSATRWDAFATWLATGTRIG